MWPAFQDIQNCWHACVDWTIGYLTCIPFKIADNVGVGLGKSFMVRFKVFHHWLIGKYYNWSLPECAIDGTQVQDWTNSTHSAMRSTYPKSIFSKVPHPHNQGRGHSHMHMRSLLFRTCSTYAVRNGFVVSWTFSREQGSWSVGAQFRDEPVGIARTALEDGLCGKWTAFLRFANVSSRQRCCFTVRRVLFQRQSPWDQYNLLYSVIILRHYPSNCAIIIRVMTVAQEGRCIFFPVYTVPVSEFRHHMRHTRSSRTA